MRLPCLLVCAGLVFGTWHDLRGNQQQLHPESFTDLAQSCAAVSLPKSDGPRVHIVTNGANLEGQMDEFFAYYKYVLGVNSIHFYHHLPYEIGDTSLARDAAQRWGVRYDTYNGTDHPGCLDAKSLHGVPPYQCSVLRRGIEHIRQTTRDPARNWVLYVDIDEFLDIPQNRTISDFFSVIGLEKKAVRFPQYLFGTENLPKQEGLVTAKHMHPVDVREWDAPTLSAKLGVLWPHISEGNRYASNVYQKAAYRLDVTKYLCPFWVHSCAGVRTYYPDASNARLHHYMILDEEKLAHTFWGQKHGISEKLFRQLLNADIMNEVTNKVDLTADKDWNRKVATLEKLIQCKDQLLSSV